MKLLLIAALLALCAILFVLGFIIGYYHGSAPDEECLWPLDRDEPPENFELFTQKHFNLN